MTTWPFTGERTDNLIPPDIRASTSVILYEDGQITINTKADMPPINIKIG
jgi:hypothetical protein